MCKLAVHEPEPVNAARVRPRGVEERQAEIGKPTSALDAGEVCDVEEPHPGRLLADLVRLIGHRKDVARETQGIAARDAGSRRRELIEKQGSLWVRDVENAQASLLPFVREIEDPTTVRPLLDGHSLAAIAIAVQLVMRDELHR